MFKELEKINKVNSAISKQCFEGRLFNVKNVVNLEQRLETFMCLSPLACEMSLSHSSVTTKTYTIFSLNLFLSEFQSSMHHSLFTKTASYWTLASWVVNMDSILHSYCNRIAITSQKFPFIPLIEILYLLPSSTIYDPMTVPSKQPLIQNTPSMIIAAQCLKLTLCSALCSLRLVIFTLAPKPRFGIR